MRKSFTLLLFILILILAASNVSVEGYKISSATLYVYGDGTVLVQQTIYAENPPESISVLLLGNPFLIEVKSDSTLIHVNVTNNTAYFIAPDKEIKLSYMTSSLTNKTGEEWTVSYFSTYKTLVILPENSMPYNISPSNFDINIINESVALVMPTGKVIIKYILTPSVPERKKTTVSSPYTVNIRFLYIALITIAILSIIYLFYQKRKKGETSVYKDLDERDNRILNVLSKYGELTAREIMEKTSIPKTPLYRRLRKLVSIGLIETKTSGGVLRYRIKSKSIVSK